MGSTPYLRGSLVSMCFSIIHHKGLWCLIRVCDVFRLVYSTSSGTQHLWIEFCEWITQTLRIFLCTKCFSKKWNFEAIGKSKKPLIRSFKTFIRIKFFNQLLCSTFKPPSFDCFHFFPCLFKIIVQCLFHQWKPQSTNVFWFTRFSSCLSDSLMRFLPTLNFLEAEALFLSFSEDHCVTDNSNSCLYDFLFLCRFYSE